jgi:hypothetical protein
VRATVECPECGREIAEAQLANHVRSMHRVVALLPASSPPAVAHAGELVFEDPPIGRAKLEVKIAPVLEKLKGHPGRWARIQDYAGKTSAATQVGKVRKAFPEFEFRAARLAAGGSALYARTKSQ